MIAEQQGYWLFSQINMLALIEGNLPFGSAKQWNSLNLPVRLIGEFKAQPLWLVLTDNSFQLPSTLRWESLRSQLSLSATEFNLLGRGVSLNHFFNTHRYCGCCATPTEVAKDELAVYCPNCEYRHYPVICPCIIVAVRKGEHILLANHQRHKGGIYTTLAGFVETGETFEHAVRREVFEESGIIVKNIRYVASQPWAFPNSLMVGYLADYAAGDIDLQVDEIQAADWFHCNQPLPPLPETGTIARQLIEMTLDLCRAESLASSQNIKE